MVQLISRLLLFSLLILPVQLVAQESITLKGKITDLQKNAILGAHIRIENTSQIATSDANGYYSLNLISNKEYKLAITHISYKSLQKTIVTNNKKDLLIDFSLELKSEELQDVTVNSTQDNKDRSTTIDSKLLTHVPVTGSGAIEQIIKTLPGVSSNNELSSQYTVRGGNFDENLVYINGIEIYRPNLIRSGQQEGLSIINPHLVSSVKFSSGGFDAKYGDKLSSVLDVKYKTPNKFEASIETSLLGSSLHIGSSTKNQKLSFIGGIRYKANDYLLNSLETKGEYKPNFTDYQAMLNYRFSSSLSIHFWASLSNNNYNFKPKTRSTSFGTINEALQLKIYFDGQEKDKYETNVQAVTLKFHPNSNSYYRLSASRFEADEKETFDIMGQYFLSDLFVAQGGNNAESIQNLGVGTFIDHARNKLKKTVNTIDFKGDHNFEKLFFQWGLGAKQEEVKDRIDEWQYQDSADYSIPASGSNVNLAYSRKANNTIDSKHLTSFIQGTYAFEIPKGELQFTGGLRYHYWDYTEKSFISPRGSLIYIPESKKKQKLHLSIGYYQQTPSYREMLDINGQVSSNLGIQKSIHYVFGHDFYFKAWDRPFKLSSELYYKDLKSIIPYDIENVRIRYYGDKRSKGYATGLDMRINGEFIPGTESWASLSIMKTQEDIIGDDLGYIPRPTDQRFNFSMFFQDYLPNNPLYKMHLSLFYGGKLPVWTPKKGKGGGNFRMPNYRRIDLGFSKVLVDENHKSKNGLLKHFKSMWIGIEVFNVLDIKNTVSYLWINDISQNQYAIPNYLTSRKINFKLSATF